MGTDCVIALDVGGTTIKVATVDRQCTVIASRSVPTGRRDDADAVVERIIATAADQRADAEQHGQTVHAAGVVVPGIVDEDRGVAVVAANLGWRDVPFRALLEERLGLPVAFGHDVRAGGLAEGSLGAAQGVRDYLFLAVGTGIAAAVVLDGQPYAGHGYGGEIGHLVVDPDGPQCGCGAWGCLEAIASAAAIAEHYAARSGERVDASVVCERVVAGDRDARAVWREAVDALATALAAYVSLLAPELVVVGGGRAAAGATMLGPLERELDRRLTFQRRPKFVVAQLGEQAGALGAALLAWRQAGS
jgi:glucokinase